MIAMAPSLSAFVIMKHIYLCIFTYNIYILCIYIRLYIYYMYIYNIHIYVYIYMLLSTGNSPLLN